jgi:large subunit ribosomal protein L10
MAISHLQKVAILDKIQLEVAPQKAVMLITTADAAETLDAVANVTFRKEARSKGVVIKVVKNTLIQKAFAGVPVLVGPTYVAYLEDKDKSDEVTVPKVIADLIEDKFKEKFSVVGSVVNSEFLDQDQTLLLAKTSTKEESLAKIAGAINQLATKLAIAINEIPSGVVRGVSEYSKTLN